MATFPLSNQFAYAQRNGYTGRFVDYAQNQYAGYCATCQRCDVAPMGFADWYAGQPA